MTVCESFEPQTNEVSNSLDVKLWSYVSSVLSWLAGRVLRKAIKLKPKTRLITGPRVSAEREIRDEWSEALEYGFKPYVSVEPWHTGTRAFFARLVPRYGNYCGPNWSSGRESGSSVWDLPPIDELDMCCYRHDMGYDTQDQAKLLMADLAFVKSLEKRDMKIKGSPLRAFIYKTLCKIGFRLFLIPYRMLLVNLKPLIFGWLGNKPKAKILPKRLN